jgi:hypothetical protein
MELRQVYLAWGVRPGQARLGHGGMEAWRHGAVEQWAGAGRGGAAVAKGGSFGFCCQL